jgi:hypothetical protein
MAKIRTVATLIGTVLFLTTGPECVNYKWPKRDIDIGPFIDQKQDGTGLRRGVPRSR